MQSDIAQSLAQARIADLHRYAAHRRLARTAAPGPDIRTVIGQRVAAVRVTAARWITARTQPVAAQPACCPA